MRYRFGLALLGTLLIGAGSPPDLPVPKAEEIKEYATRGDSWRVSTEQPFAEWETGLRAALTADPAPDRAADMLAARYGMDRAAMRELVRLWLFAKVHQYNLKPHTGMREEVRDRFAAAVDASGRTVLALEVAAAALDDVSVEPGECDPRDFDALMAGAKDRVGELWTIARVFGCNAGFQRMMATAPDRAMPALIRVVEYGTLEPRDTLPLYAWLTSDAALSRVAEPDRPALAAWLYRNYLEQLFDTGLSDQAVTTFEGLSPALRETLLSRERPALHVTVDGLPLVIDGEKMNGERPNEDLRRDLAATYALAGRKADAEAMFAGLHGIAAARRVFECQWRGQARDCGARPFETDYEQLILDEYLHHLAEDPYPLAEIAFAGSNVTGVAGPSAELNCAYFSAAQYAGICERGRTGTADRARLQPQPYRAEEQAAVLKSIDGLAIPGLGERRAAFRAALAASLARNGGEPPDYGQREARDGPLPSPFAELPLPAAYRGGATGEKGWPNDFARLPEGFAPVRIGRDKARVAVISVSQNYDPTGEVSAGGYWVHLSRDGGKSWDAPLYTGLTENFPYVVEPASRMPLLDGDTLNLAVAVREIDPASITYPPVALRTKRRADNLYLRMPLADLTRDSDGDGLTDIAAHRLLLDQATQGTPFLVGTTPASQCTGPVSAERQAMTALLEKLFSVQTRAIIEPVDRKPDAPLMSGWRSAANGVMRPIFVEGDPTDYACIRPDRLMIVYSKADVVRLQRFAPDFHAVSLNRVVYNRAHDRGYVIWSMGWTGGTTRMRLINGKWQIEEIDSWIT